jgi:hypothetical protein
MVTVQHEPPRGVVANGGKQWIRSVKRLSILVAEKLNAFGEGGV